MTLVHLLLSEKKNNKKKTRMIHWELITGQLTIGPDTGYPRQGLFGPLLFLQHFGHVLISLICQRKGQGKDQEMKFR